MRKILALSCTIVTLLALKETIFIYTSTDTAIVAKKAQLMPALISITLPLIILSLWLWRPKTKAG